MSGNVIDVVAAVIERDGRFLITRRLEGTHLAGYWEFPGGKCDAGEPHDACLRRELAEELGIDIIVGDELIVTEHAYPERTVRLHFHRCAIRAGDPRPLLNQQMQWAARDAIERLDFPEADKDLIALLISPAQNPLSPSRRPSR